MVFYNGDAQSGAHLRLRWKAETTGDGRRSRAARGILLCVHAVDVMLRRFYGIREFTDDPKCLLRISREVSPHAVTLEGGGRIAAGDRLLELHLWNEHVPPFPSDGPNIAWATTMRRLMDHSLSLLALQLATRSEFAEVRALHAVTPFASRGSRHRVARLARRFGFEPVDPACRTWRQKIHQAASNILVVGLVWAYSPQSLRRSNLVRDYVDLWVSRETLIAHYAAVARYE